ncbi:MAG: hypothetical protein RIT81_34975 [Deltaproteobacteria bacterium]
MNPLELGVAPWGVFEAELFGFERAPTRTMLDVARRGRLLEYVRGHGRARLSGGAVTCLETGRVVGVHSGWVARGDGISTSAATLIERAGLEALADQLEAEVP